MMREREALVACSDKSMKVGVNVWDINTGNNFLHIPSCASPPFGLLCLRNRYIVASQLNRHGSVGGGSIVIWPLNKPLKPLVNYTMEAIGPLSCTKDGLYLVGGGLSGNVYIWDVSNNILNCFFCLNFLLSIYYCYYYIKKLKHVSSICQLSFHSYMFLFTLYMG
ncbi:putative transcription factor WD40-like family [Lupinus albus]|uniref:Putative transcription factor WD40-like family n=1 Tax=Lupinus albus TaxID=3870 RepID=A0A6A4QEY0_LUPAL|nr:putative transcription factor WD40-like family [Lupinus albus]